LVRAPLLLVAGQLDPKFVGIHRRMLAQLAPPSPRGATGDSVAEQRQQQQQEVGEEADVVTAAAAAGPTHTLVELPNVGHAVHVEAPLQLLAVLQDFLASLEAE
jgi:pimeloyl-ACP methyl ester carboxylesterase